MSKTVPANLRRAGQGETVFNGHYLLTEDDEFIAVIWAPKEGILITDEEEAEYFVPATESLNSSGNIPEAFDIDTARRSVASNKALTHDEGKPALSTLPWGALKEMAAVQAYGHKKYGDFNNYRKGMEFTRQVSCIMRHLVAALEGEDRDPESGELHAAHALTRCAFLVQNIVDGKVIDDRYKALTP